MKNLSKEAKCILWNALNDVTLKLEEQINNLQAKGAHSVANMKHDVLTELDELAKELEIL